MEYNIRVFGSDTCPDTSRTRAHLGQLGLEFEYIRLEEDPEAEQKVIQLGHGKRKIPVVEIRSNGELRRLTEPSNGELDHALRESHVDNMGDHTLRRSGVSSGGREKRVA
jgi:glutaredoxin